MNETNLEEATNTEVYRYPFSPYPTGWYFLKESFEVVQGQVIPLKYFGRDLVLFRTESGRVVAADAHCPHMGAHLGHGGEIRGEHIRCPFHGWEYNADGACADIPYRKSGRVPDVCLNTWPVTEVSGLIFMFFSTHGNSPEWEVPGLPDWGKEGWIGYERFGWKVKVHAQEVAENIPDTIHFQVVHDVPTLPSARNEMRGHIYQQVMTNDVHGEEMVVLTHSAYGLGIAWIEGFIPANYHMLVAATPIDRIFTDLRLLFLVNEGKGATKLSEKGQAAIDFVVENTLRDVRIWEHKVYVERPPLVHGDGPIGALRQWSRQFYPQDT